MLIRSYEGVLGSMAEVQSDLSLMQLDIHSSGRIRSYRGAYRDLARELGMGPPGKNNPLQPSFPQQRVKYYVCHMVASDGLGHWSMTIRLRTNLTDCRQGSLTNGFAITLTV